MSEFENLVKHLAKEKENDNPFDGVEVELAYQINEANRTVTPGINVFANNFELPLFMSIGELRDAADQAESIVSQMLENAK